MLLICAEDGWVDNWSSGVPTKWNYKGSKKYQACSIYCLLPDESLKLAKPELPKLSLFNNLIWRITNRQKSIDVYFTSSSDKPIEKFRLLLMNVVSADDDLLTQTKSEKEIVTILSKANSYKDILNLYKTCRWL